MSLSYTVSTTADFERRDSGVALDGDALAVLLELEGWRVQFSRRSHPNLRGLDVYEQGGVYESHLNVHQSGALSWRSASLEFEKLVVGWFIDQVAGREDVWLYSENGDLIIRLSPDTYPEDLARVHEGWRERRDLPPGLDLG